jgi:hypothetical protein
MICILEDNGDRVIVHTSNGERGDWMVAELERGGWQYERVYPVGEDWIAGEWAAALRKCLDRPDTGRRDQLG